MIKVVQLTPVKSELNRSVELTKETMRSLELGIILHFRYRDDNVVNLNVFVRYARDVDGQTEKEVLIDTGFSFIADWTDFLSLGQNEEVIKKNEEFKNFVSYAWAFVGGYIFKQTEGTVLNTAFVPNPEMDKLIDSIHFEKVQE